ncbi:MAG: cell surface protein SprA, partial [candidate division Zixibacteria bacterium RBG_16_48_11]
YKLKSRITNGINFDYLPAYPGLSIARDYLPLLRSRPPAAKTVSTDEQHASVKIETVNGAHAVAEPAWLGLNRYLSISRERQVEQLWQTRTQELNTNRLTEKERGSLLQYEIPIKFPKLIRGLIGEGGPGLKVTGYRRIEFAGRSTWVSGLKSTATSRQSKFPSLDMKQTSRFTIDGNIGSKITVKVDQDSKRLNDLENNLQLRYTGEPEEIIQTIEAGNTNLAIGGARFVGHSQSLQGLFGFKSTAKLGGLDLTMIMSQEKGASNGATFWAGAEALSDTIRDYEFLPRTFYYLGRSSSLGHTADDYFLGDSIIDIELYAGEFADNQPNYSPTSSDVLLWGLAVVDPTDTLKALDTTAAEWRRGEWASKRFKRLIRDQDYFVSPTQFWVKLNRQLGDQDALAAYLVVKRATGQVDTIGNSQYNHIDPSRGINYTYLLKLIRMDTPRYHWTDADGSFKPYVTWEYEWKNVYDLGIDEIDPQALTLNIYKGTPGVENIQIDKDSQDSVPYIRITGLDVINLSGDTVPDNKVDGTRFMIYDGFLVFPQRLPFISDTSYSGDFNDTLQIKPDSIYYSSDFDHRRQATVYYIYFYTTQRRTTYSLGSQEILEGSEVVKLNGRVLTRGVDYNVNYEFGEISFLTEAAQDPNAEITVDYQSLDFLQAQKKSLYGIQGERAFSKKLALRFNALYKSVKSADARPRVGNEPNRTFVWDVNFHSELEPALLSKLADALPLLATSAPSRLILDGEIAQSLSNPNTRDKIYMDDFEGVATATDLGVRRSAWTLSSPPLGQSDSNRGKLIWYNPYNQIPVKEIWPNREAGRSQERVNVLTLRFSPDTATVPPSNSWQGLIRAMPRGTEKQGRSKYLEIWVQITEGRNNPVLRFDLGRISEDINADNTLNTEDIQEAGIYNQRLDVGEDVGLDGQANPGEPNYHPVNNPDPNQDDWYYNSNDPDNVEHINGTENNADDPDRGRIPDTEDINHNQSLDLINSYFSFAIELDDSTYSVPGTENNGWRLYRIPLQDSSIYQVVGSPDWNDINFARLSLSGVDSTTVISIAEIKLAGNRWETPPYDSLLSGEFFDVATKSTYENPDYVPPPGVAGKYDPNQNLREAEQSLALVYRNIAPLRNVYATRTFFKAEDYTYYGKIKMFVHGPDSPGRTRFFYRVGLNPLNYYEYHVNIYPGWDERNWVDLDFEVATALKLKLQELKKDSASLDEYSEGNYRVKGNPTFAQIQWLAVGIENLDSLQDISGEIWVDEMTSAEVRKKPGLAAFVGSQLQLADVLTLNTSLSRQDSEFHDLRKSKGDGFSRNSLAMNGRLEAHKFLPPSWEVSLPVGFNYSHSLTVPRLATSSDIILPKELRDEHRTESTTKGFSVAPRFNKNLKNWIYNWTIRRTSFSYNYNSSQSYSLGVPVNRKSGYGTHLGYDASPRRQFSIPFLKWTRVLGVPQKLAETGFGVFPKTLSFSSDIAGTKSHAINSAGVVTDNFTRGLTGGINAQMDLVKGIPLVYRYSTTRDLRNSSEIVFSLNPKKAKLGFETSMSESFNTSYNPNWFKFMTQSFTYQSSYRENADRNQVTKGARNVSNSSGYAVNGNFNLSYLYQKLWPKPRTEGKVAGDTIQGKTVAKDTTQAKAAVRKPNLVGRFFKEIITLPNNLSPISYNYSKDRNFSRNGLLERPSLWYRLGFQSSTDALRLADIDPVQSSYEGSNTTERFGLRSGVIIFRSLNTSFGYTFNRGISQGLTGDPRFRQSRSYPDFGLQWGKVKIPPLLNRYINNLSYQLRYVHDVSEEGNHRNSTVETRRVNSSFSPLAAIALAWKFGVSSSIRVDKGRQESRDYKAGTSSITNNSGVAVTSNYNFSSPKGIKIPLLGHIKFQSNLNLSLDVQWRNSVRRTAAQGRNYTISANSSEFWISPRGSYNFSSQINGGFQARWSDRHDRQTGNKTHSRELGIWVEVKF